jgi:predicted transcriptional regulator
VAALVAAGLTNEEIAERLTLVPGTVANHLEGILRRLTLPNRTSLATWAVEHGLYRSEWDEEEFRAAGSLRGHQHPAHAEL